jgi:hypothetical protein
LTTTEIELTEGKHYWEVELLVSVSYQQLDGNWTVGQLEYHDSIFIGISRPNLDPTGEYPNSDGSEPTGFASTDGWYMSASTGSLWGNGKQDDDKAGEYKQGDRVGMLLDLDNGSLRFFKNGVAHGPGYPAGSVTGPVVHAVHMNETDASVRLLSNAEVPAGV